jgi:hypothetical protein
MISSNEHNDYKLGFLYFNPEIMLEKLKPDLK